MLKNRIYIFLLIILILLCFSLPASAETKKLSLEDCIELALENNELLRASGYEIQAAEKQYMETKARFWPIFEYEYRAAPVPTDAANAFNSFFQGQLAMFNSLKFRTIIPVFATGQFKVARQLGKHGLEAAKEKEIKQKQETVLQIKQLYNGILLASELETLISDSINKIQNKLDEQEAMDIPDYSPFALLKLKMFKLDLEKRLSETKQNKELAYDGLKIQIGFEQTTKIKLTKTLLKPEIVNLANYEKYLNASIEERPEFKLLDIGVSAKKLQYKLEKLKLGPKAGFAFFTDIGRTSSTINNLGTTDDFNNPFNYTRAGIGLQISGSLDFHSSYAKIKKAKAEYYKTVHERSIANKGLELELKKSLLNAQRMKENVTLAKKSESIARQMLFLSKSNMDIGLDGQDDYKDALQAALLTRGQYYKSVFDYNIALAELEQKIGSLEYEKLTTKSNISEDAMFNIEK